MTLSSELHALQHVAERGAESKLRAGSIRKEGILPHRFECIGSYAEPLSPLRERDLLALAELFQHHDIYAIETDINHTLLRLLPEPCWEEVDIFDLLHDAV